MCEVIGLSLKVVCEIHVFVITMPACITLSNCVCIGAFALAISLCHAKRLCFERSAQARLVSHFAMLSPRDDTHEEMSAERDEELIRACQIV